MLDRIPTDYSFWPVYKNRHLHFHEHLWHQNVLEDYVIVTDTPLVRQICQNLVHKQCASIYTEQTARNKHLTVRPVLGSIFGHFHKQRHQTKTNPHAIIVQIHNKFCLYTSNTCF